MTNIELLESLFNTEKTIIIDDAINSILYAMKLNEIENIISNE
jgi:hypothetical protein